MWALGGEAGWGSDCWGTQNEAGRVCWHGLGGGSWHGRRDGIGGMVNGDQQG